MKKIKSNPGAKRLVSSLRNMGYNFATAIADIVDNSIAAGASEVFIDISAFQNSRKDTIPEKKERPSYVAIADNGVGMNRKELQESMRFGSVKKYQKGDLGKYGLGLKSASLSQCRILTVSSKAKASAGIRPRQHIMRWDLDHIYETDSWEVLELDTQEIQGWEKIALNHACAKNNGTVILWTNLENNLNLLSEQDEYKKEKFLAHLIEEVSSHLRMVFHRFIQGSVTGHRKLNIYVCGTILEPWDPFCREETTEELDIKTVQMIAQDIDGSKIEKIVTISPYILPREDEFSSKDAWNDASGPKKWNQQQGLYFYRNDRLLQAGGWNRIRSRDEHTKLLRIAVDFTDELDSQFTINITKMKANLPVEIREIIKTDISTWIKRARARYDDKDRTAPRILENNGQSNESKGKGQKIDEETSQYIKTTTKSTLENILIGKNTWTANEYCSALIKIIEGIIENKISTNEISMIELKDIYDNL